MAEQLQQEEMNIVRASGLNVPLGFRFHPSDKEIVSHYLTNKVRNTNFTCIAIGEVNLNKTEPWDLPKEAKWGEKEWYFFFQKDRKYPTGLRANRATEAGYWKSTGKDKEVYNTIEGVMLLVGMKKTLVFYQGRAPRGNKTNWVMHEYRLEGSGRLLGRTSASSSTPNTATTVKASASPFKDEWVVCRVFQKTTSINKITAPAYQVAMAGTEIGQNQNNILAIPIPMPLHVPMQIQFPILLDFAMDLVPPYYPNIGFGIPPMVGIVGADRHQINGALFGNLIAAPPQMNFYNEIVGMGAAAGHMGMGADGIGGFDVAVSESRPSSTVSQMEDQANVTEISSMMSVTGQGLQPPL